MSLNKRIILALLSFVLSIIPASMMIGASQTAPPVGKTGAPGDGSCAECHTGAATNPGAIVINVETLGYTPNRKQTISVNIYRTNNPVLAGFQLTARLSTNGQAGFFEPGGNTLIQVKDGIQYVSHKGPHVPNDQTNEPHFKFSWTPPGPGAGEVTFYAMAVVGNANGTPEGNVYKSVIPYRMATNDMPPGYRWQTFSVPGTISTSPEAISSNGTVTGTYIAGIHMGGFLRYPSGEIRTFGIPGVGFRTSSINAQGAITGITSDSRAFVRDPDGRISFLMLPGTRYLRIAGISDNGTLFGQYTASNFDDTLFTKAGDEVRAYRLRDSYNEAFGITSSGMPYSGRLGDNYAYVHKPAGILGLSTICTGHGGVFDFDLNDSGMALGVCGWPEGQVFPSVVMAETGRNVMPDDFDLRAVNNAGQIAGYTPDRKGLVLTPCDARPLRTSYDVGVQGASITIPVESSYPDCRPNSDHRIGYPPGAATLTIPANNYPAERKWKIWVAGADITVTQPPQPCVPPTLSRRELIPSIAHELDVSIIVNTWCPAWSLQSDSNWLIPTLTAGSGSRSVTVRANTNTGPARAAMLNLNGVDYRIVQQGAEPCLYTVNPAVARVPASGGPVTLQISSPLGCSWGPFYSLNASWLHGPAPQVEFPTGGTGAVTLWASPNFFDTERRTTILSGTIVQDGAAASGAGLRLVTVAPCRVLDTRDAAKGAVFGPPGLNANIARHVPVQLSACGVSSLARAYSLQVTAYPSGPLGYLTLYPKGVARPHVSTLNSLAGRVVTNSAILPAGEGGEITIVSSGNTDVTVVVNGFFVDRNITSFPTSKDFYPQTPCRLLDTRLSNAPLSPGTRLPIPLGACAGSILYTGVTANVLNITAIPNGPLESLSAYRPGEAIVTSASVSAQDGQTTAASVIVETNDFFTLGALAATEAAHAVVDGSGYFSRLGNEGGGLRFYPVTPCRLVDTRAEGGKTGAFGPPQLPAGGVREIPVPQGGCGAPPSARAYALNFTVVPPGPLSYITAWPAGSPQPLVSTLNSYLGQVVANAAIVPAGTNAAIRVFASNATDLVVDISGYFAP